MRWLILALVIIGCRTLLAAAAGGVGTSDPGQQLDPPLPPGAMDDLMERMAQRRAQQLGIPYVPPAIQAVPAQPPATRPVEPAALTLTLLDSQDKPISNTKVTATLAASTVGPLPAPVTGQTDSRGIVSLTVPVAYNAFGGANATLAVEQPGRFPFKWNIAFFEGAHIVKTYHLIPPRTTTIHVRGPDGQAIENVPLQIDESFDSSAFENRITLATSKVSPDGRGLGDRTDAHGDFVWEHTPCPDGFIVSVGTRGNSCPLAAVRSPAVEELTVTIPADLLARVFPPRILDAKLLRPDGKPATDWFYCPLVVPAGSFSASSGMTVATVTNFNTSDYAHPAADGSFQIRAPSDYLLLVSPEGCYFLYCLSPQSWPPDVNHFTLTTPPTREPTRYRLLDTDGNPIRQLPIYLASSAGGISDIRFNAAYFSDNPPPAKPGSPILSDDQGWFSIPNYPGTRAGITFGRSPAPSRAGVAPTGQYRSAQRGGAFVSDTITLVPTTDSTLGPALNVGRRGAAYAAAPECHLILKFVDSDGQSVPDVRILNSTFLQDTEGFHYFAPAGTQLELNVLDGVCKPLTQTIRLDNSPRQIHNVRVERNKTLRGRVLDAAGKPVARANVRISLAANPDPARYTPEDAGNAYTDAQGNFSFAGVPAECFLTVAHNDFFYHYDLPPVVALPVHADHRDLLVRLPPGGSATILLPDEFPHASRPALIPVDAADPSDKTIVLNYDATLHAYRASGILPGAYHLPADLSVQFGDLSTLPIQITASQTTTLDLRTRKPEPWAGGAPQNLPLVVERDGKPVSGAEIAVFAETWPVELMQRRLDAYLNAPTIPDARALVPTLVPAASTVLDLLPKTSDNPDRTFLIDELRTTLTRALATNDNLTLLTADLSPDTGTVRFPARAGQTCVAVARIRGVALGVQKFTVPADVSDKNPLPIHIALQPLRYLLIHSDPPPPDPVFCFLSPTVPFTLDLPNTLESRVLLHALDNDPFWNITSRGSRPAPLSLRVQPHALTFDALPINSALTIQLPGSTTPLRVTIPPGQGPCEITPGRP